MKKTILAMAVPALLAAGSASASINLYDANGVKVDASGAMEVQYYHGITEKITKKDGTSTTYAGSDIEGKWRLDDGDFAVNTEVAVSDDLSVLGHMAFAFEDGDTKNDELYVGFQGDNWGTITFGRQLLVSDDIGITKDFEMSINSFGVPVSDGDQVAKYVYDNGTFYGAASTLQNGNGVKEDQDGDYDKSVVDFRLGYRVNDFDVRGYYYDYDESNTEDTKGYQFEAEYAGIENVALAASFGQLTKEETGKADVDTDHFSLAAAYTMDKTTFSAGWDRQDTDGSDDAVNGYYANVAYALHSNAKVYAELGDSNGEVANGEDHELGYVAGVEVKF
ncbi:porin [Salinivibrio sp. VYel6]|nr:porin [Salinivibrio sp. VYel6]